LRGIIESLQPVVDRLRAVEQCVASLDDLYAAIPHSVPRGEGPEYLLDACIERLILRFGLIVGSRPSGETLMTYDVRVILDMIAACAALSGARLDTAPLPPSHAKTWTSNPDLYAASNVPRFEGGVHVREKHKFVGRMVAADLDDGGGLLKR
jgi:hypothetical protein